MCTEFHAAPNVLRLVYIHLIGINLDGRPSTGNETTMLGEYSNTIGVLPTVASSQR